jgi:hypothetical protein
VRARSTDESIAGASVELGGTEIATTMRDGRFVATVPMEESVLTIRASRFATSRVVARAGVDVGVVPLAPERVRFGRVVTPWGRGNGLPVVSIRGDGVDGGTLALTDADGFYILRGASPTDSAIEVRGERHALTENTIQYPRSDDPTCQCTWRTNHGRVVRNGVPVPDALIRLTSPDPRPWREVPQGLPDSQRTHTDRDGWFVIAAGSSSLTIEHPALGLARTVAVSRGGAYGPLVVDFGADRLR